MIFIHKVETEIELGDIAQNLVDNCTDEEIGGFLAELSNTLRGARGGCGTRPSYTRTVKIIAEILLDSGEEDLIADVARAMIDIKKE